MKKLWIAIMAAFALALAGCGTSNGAGGNESESSQEPEYSVECNPAVDKEMCEQMKKDFSENYDEDGDYQVTVPPKTEEPVDPDEVYNGELDASDGYVKIGMGAIMTYDDGVSVGLEQLQAVASEAVGCTETKDPCFVIIEMHVDNSEGTTDFVPMDDDRGWPVVEYVNTSGETVVVDPLQESLVKGPEADAFWEDMSYEYANEDVSYDDVVSAGDYWDYKFAYRLDDFKNVEGESYKAHFKDDSAYETVWVEDDIDF